MQTNKRTSPVDSKIIKPVNLKGRQPWELTGRTEAEAPGFWSPDVNSWLIGKVPDAGKDWGQKEKRVSEDEMAGQHHWCTGHELGQTLGDGEGQGGLTCCSPWGCRVGRDWTTTSSVTHSSCSIGQGGLHLVRLRTRGERGRQLNLLSW